MVFSSSTALSHSAKDQGGVWQKAARLYRFFGARGLVQPILVNLPLLGRIFRWWFGDHLWLGRLVERRGNLVRVEGCTIDVSAPGLSTAVRSRFILNRYERAERRAVKRFLDPSLPVVELGGSIGVVACLTNKMLKEPVRHVVVEARPELIPWLEGNRQRNGSEFQVRHCALSYGDQQASFFTKGESLSGSLCSPESARSAC